MTTTVDEKIRHAKELITDAYKELVIVLDSDTWGHSDLKDEYIDDIQKITLKLLKIKRKL